MKLRIRGNSLRLRLSQTEVTQLDDEGRVEDAITFGPVALTYVLTTSDVDRVGATFDKDSARIVVTLPKERARKWTSSEEVGIDHDDGQLKVLVEKDFACLKPRSGEDDSDAYPNPQAADPTVK